MSKSRDELIMNTDSSLDIIKCDGGGGLVTKSYNVVSFCVFAGWTPVLSIVPYLPLVVLSLV